MLSGTDFLRTLPANATAARERAVLEAVRARNILPIEWWGLRSVFGGHALVMFVSCDALRVGTVADSVRINATARTAQQIADVLGCLLPTSHICDLVWEQAVVRLPPCIGSAGPDMLTTARMLAHHTCVEAKLAGRRGLVETVGKNWVISNQLAKHPGKAANYGWFDPKAPYGSRPGGHGPHRLWQPLGLAHNLEHVDYSQIVRLVHRTCVLDGACRDLVDVLRDPQLAPLASDEGAVRQVRIPGVAVASPLASAIAG
jgi:hypothetical protein